jgi:hypothetical protein
VTPTSRAPRCSDARGWNDLSRACLRLLAQVDRIEAAARERIQRNADTDQTTNIALVMMLFETTRLTADNGKAPTIE